MKKKNVLSLTIVTILTLAVALLVWANVPAPPVNQMLGVDDTVFGDFTEADCRVCHDSGVPDRHHMLYGQPLADPTIAPGDTSAGIYVCLSCHLEDTSGGVIELVVERNCVECHDSSPHHVTAEALDYNCVHCHGDLIDNPKGCKEMECAVASSSAGTSRGVPLGIPCSGDFPISDAPECAGIRVCMDTLDLCTADTDCPAGSCSLTTTTSCYANSDCPSDFCVEKPTVACNVDGDCRLCSGGSNDGNVCSSNRNCPGGSCPATTDTCGPAGEACIDAQPCSSEAQCGIFGAEATCDDGHVIPAYSPSLVTPSPSSHAHICEGTTDVCEFDSDCAEGTCTGGTSICHVDGDCPATETCVGGVECVEDAGSLVPGNCAYCHNEGLDTASGVDVVNNHDTHHGIGTRTPDNVSRCVLCHKAGYPHTAYAEQPDLIRWCENCHGYEALHNIQVDSPNADNPGEIVVGGEDAGYGHIGRDAGPGDSDCWGCHAFTAASATGAGPLTPSVLGADASSITAGADTVLNLSGTTLTNLVGTYQWTSNVTMTGANGSAATLIPDSISSNQLTVTVPGTTAPGNYDLRAAKGSAAASNPIVISVKPAVVIADSSCNKKKGVLSITGSGFGEKPAGTDAYINAQVNGQAVAVTSWSDTQITAAVSGCSNNAAITVNALMGSATSGSNGGKPVKPCKGKGCNK